jgi:protein ImuB
MLGLQTIGDLLDLPPIGLAARLGEEIAHTLQLLFDSKGESPRVHCLKERFDRQIEWWPATTDLKQLCLAAEKLASGVIEFLQIRDAAAREASFFLMSQAEQLTERIDLRPSRATLKGEPFLELLRMRLERDGVPHPVDQMRLTLNEMAKVPRVQRSLFEDMQDSVDRPHSDLMDRLRNRLGEDNVGRASLVAEHRPENAYRYQRVDDERDEWMATPPTGRRPLQMDAPPIPIEVESNDNNQPCRILSGRHRGGVTVISGPERLECGWWDGNDVRRLYFEVATITGIRLWIFQDKNNGGWRRHGVFA